LSRQSLCVLLESTLCVRANIIQATNSQDRFTTSQLLP
jgi:hypothetical protein